MKINNIKINKKYFKTIEAELLNQLRILGRIYYSLELSRRIRRGLKARREASKNE